MDFDPRVISDGTDFGWEHGWDCNFHIGYGHDIIDEEAQNAKSCAQALRHLIAEADDECLNLEDELAILKCQLKWSEFENRRDLVEILCAAFKQKAGSLKLAIQSLKSGNASSGQDNDVALESRKPPERIAEIIYSLINSRVPGHNEQVSIREKEAHSEDNVRHRVNQRSIDGLKIVKSDSSPVSAETEMTTSEGRECDMSVHPVAVDLPAIENLKGEHPDIDHQMVNEKSTQAIDTSKCELNSHHVAVDPSAIDNLKGEHPDIDHQMVNEKSTQAIDTSKCELNSHHVAVDPSAIDNLKGEHPDIDHQMVNEKSTQAIDRSKFDVNSHHVAADPSAFDNIKGEHPDIDHQVVDEKSPQAINTRECDVNSHHVAVDPSAIDNIKGEHLDIDHQLVDENSPEAIDRRECDINSHHVSVDPSAIDNIKGEHPDIDHQMVNEKSPPAIDSEECDVNSHHVAVDFSVIDNIKGEHPDIDHQLVDEKSSQAIDRRGCDISCHDVAVDLSAIDNLRGEHPDINHQMVTEKSPQATTAADILLTEGQLSLSSILKSQGHIAQKKLQASVVGVKKPSLPLEPYVEIVDSESPSDADSFEHCGSPSSVVPGRSFAIPESIRQSEPNNIHANVALVSSTKRQYLQEASRLSANVQLSKADVPGQAIADAKISTAGILNSEQKYPELPQHTQVKDSEVPFDSTIKKQSSLSSILKPRGLQVQKKLQEKVFSINESGLPLEPFMQIGASEFPAIGDSFEHCDSPSSAVSGRPFSLPENSTEIEPDMVVAIASQKSSTKRPRQQADRTMSAHVQSLKTKVPKPASEATAKRRCTGSSLSRRQKNIDTPQLVEVKDSEVPSDSATPHTAEDNSVYDLDNLRVQFSQDSTFLTRWKLNQLYAALKQFGIKGMKKKKKVELIDELTKRIQLTENKETKT